MKTLLSGASNLHSRRAERESMIEKKLETSYTSSLRTDLRHGSLHPNTIGIVTSQRLAAIIEQQTHTDVFLSSLSGLPSNH